MDFSIEAANVEIPKINKRVRRKISKEDQLPKKICNGCSDKLNLLYAFRNTALESEQTFLSWFKDDNLTINALAETIVKEEVEVDEESLYLDLVKYSPSNEMSENSSICQDRTLTSSPIFDDGPDSTTSETFTYRIVNFYSDDDLEDQTSGLDQSATIGKPINKTQDEALAASPILPNHDLENQAKTIFPGSSSEKVLLQDDVIHGSSVSFHHIALNLSPTQETLGLESKHGGNNEKTNVSESDTITNLKNMERDCRYSLLPLQEKLVLPIFLGSSSYISDSESKNNNHQKTFSGFNSDTFVVSNEFAKGPFDYEDSGSEYLPSSDDESTSDFHMSFEEDLEVPKVQNTYPGKKTKLFKSKGKGQLDLPNAEHIMKSDDNQPSTSSKVSEELTSESDLECQKFNQCYKNDDRPFFEPAIEELDTIVLEWNTHRITRSRNSIAPHGRPFMMYNIPQDFMSTDYLHPVSTEMAELWLETIPKPRTTSDYDVYQLAAIIMEEEGWVKTNHPEAAIELYKNLRQKLLDIFSI